MFIIVTDDTETTADTTVTSAGDEYIFRWHYYSLNMSIITFAVDTDNTVTSADDEYIFR